MEIEVKLIPKNKDTFRRILEMDNILSFSAEEASKAIQKDTYYDTPDHKLAKAGAAYRIREKGDKLIATFKKERTRKEGLFKREEFEVPIKRGDMGRAASGEMDIEPIFRMRELLGVGESIVKILTVEDERTTIYLNKYGKVHFELTLDNVTFTGAKGSRKHQEIELEMKNGDEADMLKIVAFLKRHFDLIPSSESKYEIGLKAVG
ncbi:MAG: CYTH domain-containing protein [Deltaproteobacteria bacterium]|nr:CYTH domain-containing protein [Deltaproteobacteria bacterium]